MSEETKRKAIQICAAKWSGGDPVNSADIVDAITAHIRDELGSRECPECHCLDHCSDCSQHWSQRKKPTSCPAGQAEGDEAVEFNEVMRLVWDGKYDPEDAAKFIRAQIRQAREEERAKADRDAKTFAAWHDAEMRQAIERERAADDRRVAEERAKHESELTEAIVRRDNAEDALALAYHYVIGEDPQWSNMFGYEEANEQIAGKIQALEKSATEERAKVNAEWRKILGLPPGSDATEYTFGEVTQRAIDEAERTTRAKVNAEWSAAWNKGAGGFIVPSNADGVIDLLKEYGRIHDEAVRKAREDIQALRDDVTRLELDLERHKATALRLRGVALASREFAPIGPLATFSARERELVTWLRDLDEHDAHHGVTVHTDEARRRDLPTYDLPSPVSPPSAKGAAETIHVWYSEQSNCSGEDSLSFDKCVPDDIRVAYIRADEVERRVAEARNDTMRAVDERYSTTSGILERKTEETLPAAARRVVAELDAAKLAERETHEAYQAACDRASIAERERDEAREILRQTRSRVGELVDAAQAIYCNWTGEVKP